MESMLSGADWPDNGDADRILPKTPSLCDNVQHFERLCKRVGDGHVCIRLPTCRTIQLAKLSSPVAGIRVLCLSFATLFKRGPGRVRSGKVNICFLQGRSSSGWGKDLRFAVLIGRHSCSCQSYNGEGQQAFASLGDALAML
jgi:hypothetical protein